MLNTKRLYQADGFAVKELLKIAGLLYDAQQVNAKSNKEKTSSSWSPADMVDLSSHVSSFYYGSKLFQCTFQR